MKRQGPLYPLCRFWFVSFFLIVSFQISVLTAQSFKTIQDFKLTDVENNPFHLAEKQGEVTALFFIADTKDKKEGNYWLEQSGYWMQALHERFADSLCLYGVKEVTHLPLFVPKALVRAKLRKESVPYLIDWEGSVFRQFSVKTGYALIILNQDRQIIKRITQPYERHIFKEVCTIIEKLIKSNRQ